MTTPRVTVPVEPEGVSPVYSAAYDSIRKGAPGLSDATCAVIARSINMKVSRLSAAPAPEGGAVKDWDAIRSHPCYGEHQPGCNCAALATREAPAEAGEWITGDQLHEIMQSFTDRADVSEIAAKINAALALRAQPQAREDAQPIGHFQYNATWSAWEEVSPEYAGSDGVVPLYLHPTPDALREAVEALEPFAAHPDFHAGDDWPVTFVNDEERAPGVTAGDFRRARQALAALQAEQKGGA